MSDREKGSYESVTFFCIFITMSNKKIKGGIADKMSVKDIADKHGVSVDKIEKELEMGVEVEMEHVDDKDLSRDIAIDHLVEFPDYYTRLKDMEKEAEGELKETRSFIKKALREGIELSTMNDSPKTTRFAIGINGKEGGHAMIHKETGLEDAIELSDFQLKPSYEHNTINVAKSVISALFNKFDDTHTIAVMPTSKSRLFWEKAGATRLNDTYHIFQRGH